MRKWTEPQLTYTQIHSHSRTWHTADRNLQDSIRYMKVQKRSHRNSNFDMSHIENRKKIVYVNISVIAGVAARKEVFGNLNEKKGERVRMCRERWSRVTSRDFCTGPHRENEFGKFNNAHLRRILPFIYMRTRLYIRAVFCTFSNFERTNMSVSAHRLKTANKKYKTYWQRQGKLWLS